MKTKNDVNTQKDTDRKRYIEKKVQTTLPDITVQPFFGVSEKQIWLLSSP